MMNYTEESNFFVGSLEEDGVLTDCSIKTLEPDEVLDFNFCSTNVVNKIIMKVRLSVNIKLLSFGTYRSEQTVLTTPIKLPSEVLQIRRGIEDN